MRRRALSLCALFLWALCAGCPRPASPAGADSRGDRAEVARDAGSRSSTSDRATTVPDNAALDASALALDGGSVGARGGPIAGGPYNVLYLTVDSLRADVLHGRDSLPAAFGEDPARYAPTLMALARRGVSYRRAYALSSYTSMSVGGMYGGRLPGELPRDGYFFGEYRPSALMLAERLSAGGVHTMGAHAHFYFRRGGAGLDQGFARWEVVPGLVRNNHTDVEVTADRHEALCERLLSEPGARQGPWFLHAHFMDPHDQYRRHAGAPEPTVARGQRALYLGEVWFTDQHIARLLAFLERQPFAARTVVIVSADHGECFGEHGHYRHGFYLWEELVRVPWIFVVPGRRRG